jgi:hypothetical protein
VFAQLYPTRKWVQLSHHLRGEYNLLIDAQALRSQVDSFLVCPHFPHLFFLFSFFNYFFFGQRREEDAAVRRDELQKKLHKVAASGAAGLLCLPPIKQEPGSGLFKLIFFISQFYSNLTPLPPSDPCSGAEASTMGTEEMPLIIEDGMFSSNL